MSLRLIFCLNLLVLVIGCSNKIEEDHLVTNSMGASDFILEITTPTVIKIDQILKVKGKLTYVGDQPIELYHGEPIIRFYFTGTDINYAYTDGGFRTKVKPGQTFEVEEEFKVTERGKQNITTKTTSLVVNGQPIKGKGNNDYFKDNMNERVLELEESKITLEPFMIMVK